ncbi:hypothetical protein Tcan_13758 [Toxocara canis]|uniref:Uncharacterized protein n=1 Tax=Toxocara canis TaxID=6265 RepID=A0A0B2W276_TOXCA|nr:hypothetical protein Tcan_08744 [Toxocara canis]KHN88278.1 hypothetical protein Tcan_13758 [Toxocara canis]
MALGMNSETYAKLRADIRADLREEIMAEVRQQLIPMVRALVQEVTDSVKSTVAATQFDQGTHYLDAVQQAEKKEIRERSVVLVRVNEVTDVPPRERNNVDCGTALDIFGTINSDSVPHQIFRMGSQQEGRKRPVKVIFGNSHDAKQVLRNARSLKGTRFQHVFIRPSLTAEEKKKQWEEHQKRRQNQQAVTPLILRGGQLVRRVDRKNEEHVKILHDQGLSISRPSKPTANSLLG